MSMKPTPIVFSSSSYGMGGMEEHLLQLGRGLVGRGFRVAALCARLEALTPLRRALIDAGIEVHCPAERQASPLGSGARLRDLVQTLRRYPGCIVHLHYGG